MISSILSALPSMKQLQGKSNDDWVDRINHVWTVLLLVLFAIFVTTGLFVGDNIDCWCSGDCHDQMDFVKSYCWIKNTYYFPLDKNVPNIEKDRKNEELTYYQWVSLIMMFMALLFKFPNIIWRLFNEGAGINLDKIVEMSEDVQMKSPADRDTDITTISNYINRWLNANRQYKWNKIVHAKQRLSSFCCFLCNKREGRYLTAFYLFVKLMYLLNVVSQFFILNAFLSTDYNFYGFEVLAAVGDKTQRKESLLFPVNTLCDVYVRHVGNKIQEWLAQCVLPMNLYNEKIFTFIWFWLVLVATLTAINMLSWLYRVVFKRNRFAYIQKYLTMSNELQGQCDVDLCKTFADEYLRDDGVFVLRLIAKSSSELVVSDLINKLWKDYKIWKSKRAHEPFPPKYGEKPSPTDAENGDVKQRKYAFEILSK